MIACMLHKSISLISTLPLAGSGLWFVAYDAKKGLLDFLFCHLTLTPERLFYYSLSSH